MHPINSSYQYTIPICPINTSCQFVLSIHLLNIPYEHSQTHLPSPLSLSSFNPHSLPLPPSHYPSDYCFDSPPSTSQPSLPPSPSLPLLSPLPPPLPTAPVTTASTGAVAPWGCPPVSPAPPNKQVTLPSSPQLLPSHSPSFLLHSTLLFTTLLHTPSYLLPSFILPPPFQPSLTFPVLPTPPLSNPPSHPFS